MILKDYINQNPGFRYVVEQLELFSGVSRQQLLSAEFCSDHEALQRQWDELELMLNAIGENTDSQSLGEGCNCDEMPKRSENTAGNQTLTDLGHALMQVRDITTTFINCQRAVALDDVQLFEIKNFAMLNNLIAKQVSALGVEKLVPLPDLSEVVAMLDPDRSGVPHFYIYDSYDPRLSPLRKELRALQAKAELQPAEEQRIAELWQQNAAIEDEVRRKLSSQLSGYAGIMLKAMHDIGRLDILLAKSKLALRYCLCKPQIASDMRFVGLVNLRLDDILSTKESHCQPVDIAFGKGVCVITGANMAGKTVLLKSVGIALLMAQFGFYVPAHSARIVPVDDVMLCLGDEQDEMNGLSSFASEMLKINEILKRAKSERLLVLIDEPARTTNPVEGMAIVDAIVQHLNALNSFTLVTTHYSGLKSNCKRLRVKGLRQDLDKEVRITPQNINNYIDYSLVEDVAGDVPQEALRIAEILDFDNEVLAAARKYLGK